MTYTPKPDSIAGRVLGFLQANPGEELTRADVMAKYGVLNRHVVQGLMRQAVQARLLTFTRNANDQYVYRLAQPDTREPLSIAQAQVLAYMVKFLQMNDCLPPMSTIARAFGWTWTSPNDAQEHVSRLEAKGYLTRNEIGGLMLADRPEWVAP